MLINIGQIFMLIHISNFFESDESNIRLRNICDFYESYSKIFPNYYALPEKDFIFKNIKKKKKIIDEKNKKIEKEISNGYKGINDVFFDKKVEKEMKKIDDINVKENEDSLFQNNLSISIISKNRYPAGDIENGKVGESVIMNNNSSVIENSTMSIEKGILNVLDDSKIYPEDLANLIKNDINDKKKQNNNNNNTNKNKNNNKKAHMKSNDILSPGRGNYNNNKTHNNKYYSGSNKKNINHNDKSNEKKDKSRDNTKDKITKNKDDKFNINKKKKSLTNNNKNENQILSPQPSRRNNKTTKNVSNFNSINPSKNKENKENKDNKDNKDNKENKENKTEKKNQKMFKTLTINDTNKITDKKKDSNNNNNNKKNKLTKQNSNIVGMREKDKEKINSAFKTKHIYKRNRESLLSDNINGPILSLGNSNKEDVSLININNKTINNNKKSSIISNKKTGLIKRNSFDKRRELFSPKHFKTKTETSFSSKNIKFENKLKMEGNSSPNNKNNNNNNTPEKSSLTEHKDSTTIESKGFLTSTPSATNINCKPLAIKVNRKVYITKKSTDNID